MYKRGVPIVRCFFVKCFFAIRMVGVLVLAYGESDLSRLVERLARAWNPSRSCGLCASNNVLEICAFTFQNLDE